jgi:lipoprotein-anchoring transpeptidase ErfK/SrfK
MTRPLDHDPHSPGARRGSGALAAAALAAALVCGTPAPATAATPAPAAMRPLVSLLHDHVARSAPSLHAARIEAVAARRPLTRVRTVLPVLGRSTDRAGRSWLRVRLPGRPNGHSGWIPANDTRLGTTPWRLQVDLSARRVTVFRGGDVRRRFRAVVGKPSTPTPRGSFFVEEALALPAAAAGGPYALATSARSNVYQEFEGGPGQIAIHGRDHLAGARGSASSHGCIRLGTGAITWLAQRVGAGVPLTVVR